MGKFKELFTKAQERRMEETGCSLEQAAEWVEQQTVGFIIDYTDVWKKVDNDEEEKPWPQMGDTYYSIYSHAWPDDIDSGIHYYTYANDHIDKNLQIMNNFFRTKEDAKFEYERLGILQRLKELSDDDQPWDTIKGHYYISYDPYDNAITVSKNLSYKSINNIYFASYKSTEAAIKIIGEDEIKKYLFGVNE